jgi:hypothetical protein
MIEISEEEFIRKVQEWGRDKVAVQMLLREYDHPSKWPKHLYKELMDALKLKQINKYQVIP